MPIWVTFSWTLRTLKSKSGEIWNFIKGTGLPWLGHQFKGHKGTAKGLHASGPKGLEPIIHSIPTDWYL